MRRFLMINFCFLVCLGLNAQPGSKHTDVIKDPRMASPNAPKIDERPVPEEGLFFIEDIFDFGKIPQGKPVTHNFYFVNKGKLPFSLNNVQASCGCTTPVWDKEMIRPGDTGKIAVGYNAAAEGPFDRSITIIYNDNLTRVIHIKGEVWKTSAASAPENAFIRKINGHK